MKEFTQIERQRTITATAKPIQPTTKGPIMNIFLLSDSTDYDEHIVLQAHYHCDRHVVKMIAESTQMLVTALHRYDWGDVVESLINDHGLIGTFPCKRLSNSQSQHPCAVWARNRFNNTYYLARLALELCHEHQARYPLSPRHAYFDWLESLVDAMEARAETPEIKYVLPEVFPVAISDRPELRSTATHHQDAVTHYRSYYYRTKRHFATWKRRRVPAWFLREEELFQQKQGL